MAPKQTIETYAEGMMYKGQEVSTKEEIGVDSARYLMIIDGQSDTIHTGGDGYWGRCEEYSREIGNKKYGKEKHTGALNPSRPGYSFPSIR